MNDYKNILDDSNFRKLLADSKLTANDNLMHRVMQQIETEKALAPQRKIKSAKPILRTILSIVSVLYILVMGIGLWAYIGGGINALTSSEFILPAIAISCICAIYGLVTILDEKRYS